MVVGTIKVSTCYGIVDIQVEIRRKGPYPGTAWVTALNGLEPFTKTSHGGPYQDSTAVVHIPNIRDVHLEPDPDEEQNELCSEEPAVETPFLAPDWFLESAYEDQTCIE